MIEQLKHSLKHWDMGQIIHKCQMLEEQDHWLTREIRNGKLGMIEATRIHTLQLEMETERIAKLEATKAEFQAGIALCNEYLKPKKPAKKKKDIFVPPDPVEKILKEVIEVPVDLTPAQVKQIEEKIKIIPTSEAIISEIPLTPEERAILIAEKEAKLKALQPEEEEEEFPCPHCNRIYSTEPILKRHITMRHKEV